MLLKCQLILTMLQDLMVITVVLVVEEVVHVPFKQINQPHLQEKVSL
jgi:hypothetical protein